MSTGQAALLMLGEQRANDTLARELTLDGYDTRRSADPAVLQARSTPIDVELIVIASAPQQQAGSLAALRALRAGELAPQPRPGTRVLWLSATRELAEALRAFDAGADNVLRAPFAYLELRGVNFNSGASPTVA